MNCSEEIRGEILFVLYRVSVLQYASVDNDGTDLFFAFCPKLLCLSLDALIKTQSNDVRLNCVGLFLSYFWVFFVCFNYVNANAIFSRVTVQLCFCSAVDSVGSTRVFWECKFSLHR